MQPKTRSLILIVVGLALFATGLILPRVLGGARAWSDEDATSLTEAAMDYHGKTFAGHSHSETSKPNAERPASHDQELLQAKQRYEREAAHFEAATRRADWPAMICKTVGLFVVIVGTGWHFFGNRSAV